MNNITKNQFEAIIMLRTAHYPYSAIGKYLGLSMNTVKSICLRYQITPKGPKKAKNDQITLAFCEECGKPLSTMDRRPRRFCSDKCRCTYWNRQKTEEQKVR